MINLSNALFPSLREALMLSSELDKTLQPAHFIPQQEKAAKVQEPMQRSGSRVLTANYLD